MFPRRFFAGRFFAPTFFPQSEGTAVTLSPTPYYAVALGYAAPGPVALGSIPE